MRVDVLVASHRLDVNRPGTVGGAPCIFNLRYECRVEVMVFLYSDTITAVTVSSRAIVFVDSLMHWET